MNVVAGLYNKNYYNDVIPKIIYMIIALYP